MRRLALLLPFLLAPASGLADTGQVGPSFACPLPAPVDGLSQMICDNPDMSHTVLQPFIAWEQVHISAEDGLRRQL